MTREEFAIKFPNASASAYRANGFACPMTAAMTPARVAPAEKRIRQSSKPLLNKLETRFLAKLQVDYAGCIILSQAVRLELGRGIWYKCDFCVTNGYWRTRPDGVRETVPLFYEVKGPKAFRGGFENLKVAARVHQWATFYLVWESENGAWQRQEILP